MKRIVLAVAVLAALAAGQYIEKYIPLPDSFGSVFYPANLAYNPVAGRLYVPGGHRVLAVDALTGERIGRWPAFHNEGPVCYEPTGDAVYFSSYNEAADRYDLMVYDGTTGALRATIPTGYNYAAGFSPKPVAGKVLCLLGDEESTDELLVVSSTGDSVMARHRANEESRSIAFSPRANRHYIADYRQLLVLDGATDSLLVPVSVNLNVTSICYNPVNHTVCCGNDDGGEWLHFVSCSLNVVVDSIEYPWEVTGMAADSVAGRIFAINDEGNGLYSLDAATNRLVDSVTDLWNPWLVRANPDQGKVYVADYSGLHVFDALSLRRLVQLDDAWPTDLVVGEGGTRVYWADDNRGLLAIDGVGDTLVLRTPLGWRFAPLCYNPADGRAYGYDDSEGGLLSFDVASGGALVHRPSRLLRNGVCCSLYNRLFAMGNDSIVTYLVDEDSFVLVESLGSSWTRPSPVWHDAVTHRVFVGTNLPELVVLDCATHTVVERIQLGWVPGPLQVDDTRRRLYLSGGGNSALDDTLVACIDIDSAAVIWQASVPLRLFDIVHNATNNCLYATGYRIGCDSDMVVLDCARRQVVAGFPLPIRRPITLACSPRSGKVYVAGDFSGWPNDSAVAVVDCASQSVIGRVAVCGVAVYPYHDERHDLLYVPVYRDGLEDAIVVLDCQSDSVTRVLEPVHSMWFGSGRLFPAGDGRIITSSGGQMPWITVIRDTTPVGIAERSLTPEASRITPAASVVRGVFVLPRTPNPGPWPRALLLDVTGRKVMELQAGENDVSRLAPGVYFVRQASSVRREASSVTKVVITR